MRGARGAISSLKSLKLHFSYIKTWLAEPRFNKNAFFFIFLLTRGGRFATFWARCAANGGAHPNKAPLSAQHWRAQRAAL